MKQVFAKIKEKDHDTAFVHLWLLASETVNTGTGNCQQASLWMLKEPPAPLTINLAEWLHNPDDSTWKAVRQYPLKLFRALDKHLSWRRHNHSLIEVAIAGNKYALVRRRFPSCAARRQSPNPRHWAPNHDVFPLSYSAGGARMEIEVSKPEHNGKTLPEEVRCRLSHFDDDIALLIKENPEKESFIATGVSDPIERARRLSEECRQSGNDQAHFWIAPELTAPRTLQKEIAQELATNPQENLLIGIPGSFHWEENKGFWNGSDVVDGVGSPLFTHRKMTQFSYQDKHGNTLSEGILTARRIFVVDTPLGLACVVICKDFSDAGAQIIKTALTSIAPDWLLVASYGDKEKTIARHSQTACELETQCGTRSLIANQEPHIQIGTRCEQVDPAPGFAHAAKTTLLVEPGGTTIKISLPSAPTPATNPAQKPQRPGLKRVK